MPSPSAHTRERVRGHLRAAMTEGALPPGARVNLPTVARQLEVSVTPVREAFTQLAYGGVLEVRPLRGFFVPELSPAEALTLYHAVAALETEALRLAHPLPPRRLANLAAAGADFAAATEPADRLCADAAFHDLVCAPFAGTPAGQLLLDLKVRTLFYERAYLREAELFDASVASHAEVVDGLRDDDLPLAVIALRQNWLNVVELLDARLAASAAQPSPLSPTRP